MSNPAALPSPATDFPRYKEDYAAPREIEMRAGQLACDVLSAPFGTYSVAPVMQTLAGAAIASVALHAVQRQGEHPETERQESIGTNLATLATAFLLLAATARLDASILQHRAAAARSNLGTLEGEPIVPQNAINAFTDEMARHIHTERAAQDRPVMTVIMPEHHDTALTVAKTYAREHTAASFLWGGAWPGKHYHAAAVLRAANLQEFCKDYKKLANALGAPFDHKAAAGADKQRLFGLTKHVRAALQQRGDYLLICSNYSKDSPDIQPFLPASCAEGQNAHIAVIADHLSYPAPGGQFPSCRSRDRNFREQGIDIAEQADALGMNTRLLPLHILTEAETYAEMRHFDRQKRAGLQPGEQAPPAFEMVMSNKEHKEKLHDLSSDRKRARGTVAVMHATGWDMEQLIEAVEARKKEQVHGLGTVQDGIVAMHNVNAAFDRQAALAHRRIIEHARVSEYGNEENDTRRTALQTALLHLADYAVAKEDKAYFIQCYSDLTSGMFYPSADKHGMYPEWSAQRLYPASGLYGATDRQALERITPDVQERYAEALRLHAPDSAAPTAARPFPLPNIYTRHGAYIQPAPVHEAAKMLPFLHEATALLISQALADTEHRISTYAPGEAGAQTAHAARLNRFAETAANMLYGAGDRRLFRYERTEIDIRFVSALGQLTPEGAAEEGFTSIFADYTALIERQRQAADDDKYTPIRQGVSSRPAYEAAARANRDACFAQCAGQLHQGWRHRMQRENLEQEAQEQELNFTRTIRAGTIGPDFDTLPPGASAQRRTTLQGETEPLLDSSAVPRGLQQPGLTSVQRRIRTAGRRA